MTFAAHFFFFWWTTKISMRKIINFPSPHETVGHGLFGIFTKKKRVVTCAKPIKWLADSSHTESVHDMQWEMFVYGKWNAIICVKSSIEHCPECQCCRSASFIRYLNVLKSQQRDQNAFTPNGVKHLSVCVGVCVHVLVCFFFSKLRRYSERVCWTAHNTNFVRCHCIVIKSFTNHCHLIIRLINECDW